MTKIGSVVHFYRYLFSNTSPLFYWIYCDSHITIKVTFCLVYYSDMYKSNHCKIPINSSVINIDWYSFNFDHIIFVFIIARTIWTSKLKHSIVLVMVIKVGGSKIIDFLSKLIKNQLRLIYLMGKIHSILRLTSSGDESF